MRFFSYVIAAIGTTHEDFGESTRAFLGSLESREELEPVLTALSNEILELEKAQATAGSPSGFLASAFMPISFPALPQLREQRRQCLLKRRNLPNLLREVLYDACFLLSCP